MSKNLSVLFLYIYNMSNIVMVELAFGKYSDKLEHVTFWNICKNKNKYYRWIKTDTTLIMALVVH